MAWKTTNRLRALGLSKELHWLSRDYASVVRLSGWAVSCAEILALYSRRKYRHLKRSYPTIYETMSPLDS
ncbi:hypothetical protein FIBSPDRAFT_859163 [Athelia psychrophila]|uniref:Uncharacterized protein n=1 Tax=Athelia psychrophila TaxID=1759441 RepID=A0A166L8M4_9AGAM|nr:hypothetical protein FIBSPDRAFT_859163 [Fibularhizoctonia sp. CBS 109695]